MVKNTNTRLHRIAKNDEGLLHQGELWIRKKKYFMSVFGLN